MVFHSLDFVIFFVVLLAGYWSLPFRGQNVLLLIGSYFFYGYVNPWMGGLLFLTSVTDFFAARGMEARPDKKRRFLVLSLTVNFSILCTFKYFNFFVGNIQAVLTAMGIPMHAWQLEVLLPAGISFYTFQSASYVVDVYRGKLAPRKRLLDYLLFVSFFPQLVAGPIERAGNLLAQVERPRIFDARIARGALLMMLWGFFQKLVIADNAAAVCNKIFMLENPSFPVLWAGVFAFAIQIFADFAAYTNIARGTARLFGFELMQNFNHPYFADSPGDFWRRWHISLSTWFRDYVYIPLGGNRCGRFRNALNILITFFLSGLWHGAHWNFVIWGIYHGALLIAWRTLHMDKLWKPMRVLLVFALVCVGWLFFREKNLAYAWKYLTLNPTLASPEQWRMGLYFVVSVLLMAWPIWLHPLLERWYGKKEAGKHNFEGWKWAWAQTGLAVLLLMGIVLLRSLVSTDFIYFQF